MIHELRILVGPIDKPTLGKWIDLQGLGVEDLREKLNAYTEAWADWMVLDVEAPLDNLRLSAVPDLDRLVEIQDALDEFGPSQVDCILGIGQDEDLRYCEEVQVYDSEKDFRYDLFLGFIEGHEVPSHLEFYLDFDLIVQDMAYDYHHEQLASGNYVAIRNY